MTLIFYAVILAIVQAAPPVPRKAADAQAQASQKKHSSGNGNMDPAKALPVFQKSPRGEKGEQPGEKIANRDTQGTIRISELPTVKVATDPWLIASVFLTGALVIVGGFGARYALRTLRSIERQTMALVESLRPAINVGPSTGNPWPLILDRDAPRIHMQIANSGSTPALDLSYETWIENMILPFVDFTGAASYIEPCSPLTIRPGDKITSNIPIRPTPSETQRDEIREFRTTICLRLRVTYRDAFSPKREIGFAFAFRPHGLEYLPKYNYEK